jgi:hypothetical protein
MYSYILFTKVFSMKLFVAFYFISEAGGLSVIAYSTWHPHPPHHLFHASHTPIRFDFEANPNPNNRNILSCHLPRTLPLPPPGAANFFPPQRHHPNRQLHPMHHPRRRKPVANFLAKSLRRPRHICRPQAPDLRQGMPIMIP